MVVRWDRVAVLLVLLVAFAWFVGATAGTSEADVAPPPAVVVVVQSGDTLWDLARVHAPARTGTLEYVGVIEQANGVRAGALVPGSVLELPQG